MPAGYLKLMSAIRFSYRSESSSVLTLSCNCFIESVYNLIVSRNSRYRCRASLFSLLSDCELHPPITVPTERMNDNTTNRFIDSLIITTLLFSTVIDLITYSLNSQEPDGDIARCRNQVNQQPVRGCRQQQPLHLCRLPQDRCL